MQIHLRKENMSHFETISIQLQTIHVIFYAWWKPNNELFNQVQLGWFIKGHEYSKQRLTTEAQTSVGHNTKTDAFYKHRAYWNYPVWCNSFIKITFFDLWVYKPAKKATSHYCILQVISKVSRTLKRLQMGLTNSFRFADLKRKKWCSIRYCLVQVRAIFLEESITISDDNHNIIKGLSS